MAVEIEIKLKIDQLAPVRQRLERIGAQRIGRVLENNLFFDTSDRSLLAMDCGLRLRHSRGLDGGKDRIAISYKGPRGEGTIKNREELEIVIDNQEAAASILARLGYEMVLSFEKRRETWTLDRCTVELDELPALGCFVEIECPTQAEVQKIRHKLDLSHVPAVTQTYPDLVAHHLNDRGDGATSLSFE